MQSKIEFKHVDMNALHDHLISTLNLDDITLLRVEGCDNWVRLTYPDALDKRIQDAVKTYVYKLRQEPVDRLSQLAADVQLIKTELEDLKAARTP